MLPPVGAIGGAGDVTPIDPVGDRDAARAAGDPRPAVATLSDGSYYLAKLQRLRTDDPAEFSRVIGPIAAAVSHQVPGKHDVLKTLARSLGAAPIGKGYGPVTDPDKAKLLKTLNAMLGPPWRSDDDSAA